ncbi:MAG TPA: ATP-binding SpoIIE family protein phosphatase [Gemmatimonadales bacterium]|nr:ATP-binding SpoIIE family protein phosphatase [Gemmatimonadales bacterium]
MRNGTAAVAVEDRSQVGEARRVAVRLAHEAGLSESARSDIGIVASEAASNVVRHAGRGKLLLTVMDDVRGAGLELICVDHGPGMSDVQACMNDGYSSTGTMGGGLGAMRRLAQDFSIYSAPGIGTALVCRFWRDRGKSAPAAGVSFAGVAVPVQGESVCGDAWTVVSGASGTRLLLVDGLGHGAAAAEVAGTAVRIFHEHPSAQPEQVLGVLHAGMRSTRGAAVSVAFMDRERGQVRYAGVGNISATIVSGDGTRSLVSHNGTVGHQMRKVQEFVYPWLDGALLVVHSDGLATRWKLDQYPGLFRQDPGIIAAMLYRDHARPRDDVSVVACRLSGEAAA